MRPIRFCEIRCFIASAIAAIAATLLLAACSIERIVVDSVGSAMTGGGDVYARERDPELVREALPFGLKTLESMLAISPDNRGLLESAARGFAAYAFLLQVEAERLEATQLDQARALRSRARALFLRARDLALHALETSHPGLLVSLRRQEPAALEPTSTRDLAPLYLAGATWAGALGASELDLELLAELPLAARLVRRVLTLDPAYDAGAAHDFFIAYEAARPGGDLNAARQHYAAALVLSRGLRAGLHVALAEHVAVRNQDRREFVRLLAAARAIDIDAAPEHRLVNVIAQRRARLLETRMADLFVDAE